MAVCNVNVATGDVYHFSVDLFLSGLIPLQFTRDYDSGRKRDSSVGQRWTHNHTYLLDLREATGKFIGPDDTQTEVPHPDYPADENKTSHLTTRRREDSVLISDVRGNVHRFKSLQPDDNLLCLASQIDPRGNALQYQHYSDGVLQSITDTVGRIVHFQTDGSGHIVGVSLQHSSEAADTKQLIRYEYDLPGDLRAVYNASGAVDKFNYAGHLLEEHVNPLGGRTYFKYDAKGRCIHTSRDDGSHENTFIRDDSTNSVEVRDSRGGVRKYVKNAQGKPVVEQDPDGHKKEYMYDQQGNLLYVSGESAATSVSVFYEDQGLLILQTGAISRSLQLDDKMRTLEETNGSGATSCYKYDDQSNRVEIIDPNQHQWQFAYDRKGWLTTCTDPRGCKLVRTKTKLREVEYLDDIGRRATLGYTSTDRLASATDALGHATHYKYTPADQVAAIRYADDSQTRFAYDLMGNMTSVESELGMTTRFQYNKLGAPVAMTNALGHRASFHYDTEENLVEVKDYTGQSATFQFDLMNRLTSARLFDGRTEKYRYDSFGNVSNVYDSQNRILLKIERDDAGRIAKKIYQQDWEVTFEWGDQNELLKATNPHAEVEIEWTDDARVATERVNDFEIAYEYDEVGNRVRATTSTGQCVECEWDPRNRLVKMVDVGNAEYEFSYDEANRFREWVCPSVLQRFTFDARNRMIQRQVVRRDTEVVLADRLFEYDAAGRLTAMSDQQRGPFQYEYSALGELLRVQSGSTRTEAYAFDANHNLILGRDGQTNTYGPGNRLVRSGNRHFQHDANGSITRITDGHREWKLKYNPEGRLCEVQTPEDRTIEYHYDPLGRRIKKIVDGQSTQFYWDQGMPISEMSPSGERTEYLYLSGTFLPLGMSRESGHQTFILDQAGTPTEIADSDGQVAWSGDYSAFGEVVAEREDGVRNPLRFQGQYFDEETRFHYNFFRYYYPQFGRYLRQDPLGLEAGGNVYRYVMNPFNSIDPYGLANFSVAEGLLTIMPICGWSDAQNEDAKKKMAAMNDKLADNEHKFPTKSDKEKQNKRCSAKKIYEKCQKDGEPEGKEPLPDLQEGGGKCHNQQADHILEVCAGGGEKDCNNLHPLNESVNKSFGAQVAAVVRANEGAVLNKVKICTTDCNPNPNVDC